MNAVTSRAIDPISQAAGAEGLRGAASSRCRRRSRAGGGRHARDRRRRAWPAMAVAEAVLAHEPGWQVTLVGREAGRALQPRAALAGAGGRRRRTSGSRCARPDGVTLRLGAAVRGDRHPRAHGRARRRRACSTYDDARARHRLRAVASARPGPAIARACSRSARSPTCARSARPRAGAQRAVVVGGGLLGLEAARGLRERGVDGHRRAPRRPPDGAPARPARGAAARAPHPRARHRRCCAGAAPRPCTGDGRRARRRRRAARPTSSSSPPASGPRSRSRATPGSRSAAACSSTTTCATSAPGVWAVGECAEHRGTVYGLWAPVLEQARAAGAAIAGRPTAFHGAVPATTLKVAGIDLFCAGHAAEPDPLAEEVIALDSRRERYRKLVLRDGRAEPARRCSATLGDARRLRALIASGEAVPEDAARRRRRRRRDAPARPPRLLLPGRLRAARSAPRSPSARSRRSTQVSERTGAATGCGGCRPDVEALLEARGLTRRRRTPGACPRTR